MRLKRHWAWNTCSACRAAPSSRCTTRWPAARRRGGPQAIVARNEQGAAYMADGYARETGKPGRLHRHLGPGRHQPDHRRGLRLRQQRAHAGHHRPAADQELRQGRAAGVQLHGHQHDGDVPPLHALQLAGLACRAAAHQAVQRADAGPARPQRARPSVHPGGHPAPAAARRPGDARLRRPAAPRAGARGPARRAPAGASAVLGAAAGLADRRRLRRGRQRADAAGAAHRRPASSPRRTARASSTRATRASAACSALAATPARRSCCRASPTWSSRWARASASSTAVAGPVRC